MPASGPPLRDQGKPIAQAVLGAAMRIARKFTTVAYGPFGDLPFRAASLCQDDAFDEEAAPAVRVTAPAAWPLGAVDALAAHVLVRDGLPAARRRVKEDGVPKAFLRSEASKGTASRGEADFRDAAGRLAGALSYEGWKLGYFDSERDVAAFHDELQALIATRRVTLEAALWRSCGLSWAYGAEGEQGFRADAATGEAAPAGDGLCRLPRGAVPVGRGDDFDIDIADGRPVSRRLDDPSAFDLARLRSDAEEDAAALVAGRRRMARVRTAIADALENGPAEAAENPALAKAIADAREAGMPVAAVRRMLEDAAAGLSVEDEEFDLELDHDADVWARFPAARAETVLAVPGGREASAYPAWQAALDCAYAGSGPAIQMADTAGSWDAASSALGGTGIADGSGAAGPLGAPAPAATINVLRFHERGGEAEGGFDSVGFEQAVRIVALALDIMIARGVCETPSEAIAAHRARPMAIGLANMAPLLMAFGAPYGSIEGRGLAGAVAALATASAWALSAEMAAKLGPCPGFADKPEHPQGVLRNLRRAVLGQATGYEGADVPSQRLYPLNTVQADLIDRARAALTSAIDGAAQAGLRNLSVTALAQDATAAALLGADTAGIEPAPALVRQRRLADGAIYKVISSAVPDALRALGYGEPEIEGLIDYAIGRGTLAEAPGVNYDLLRERGFADEDIEAVETALATASSIRSAFTPYVLGWDSVSEGIGALADELSEADLLSRLGFSDWEIEHANLHCCGAMTLEGAPGLHKSHLPVFDCAETCGPIGARRVSMQDRVLMAGAVQPFLSGGISLRLSLPEDATRTDFEDMFALARREGLKSLHLTRDGRSISTPVGWDELLPASAPDRSLDDHLAAVAQKLAVRAIESDETDEARERLPDRRKGYTQKASVGGHKIYLRTGEYDDGRLGEIFLDMHKEGASFRSLLNNFAIAVSLGLQYGVPLDEFVDAFTGTRFEPAGEVGGNAAIGTASSVLDYVFRELAVSYLERDDLAEVPPAELPEDALMQAPPEAPLPARQIASTGYHRRRVSDDLFVLRRSEMSGTAPRPSATKAISPPSVSGPMRKKKPTQEGA